MRLPPFLLDEWISQKNTATPAIEYDLASSTGPVWTLRELLALGDTGIESLLDTRISYTSAPGTLELRTAIADLEGVTPDDVQVVTGAAEALWILFFLAAEPGANVVLPSPGFPANTALTQSLGIQVRYYRLRPENGFQIDPEEIRGLIDRDTRLLLVNSPHNPTGTVLNDAEMETLHDDCRERGVQFVSDQVYHPIYHGQPMRSAARLQHATVIGDFSKALCLSGLRVGWIVDRHPERRERYLNARNYFTISNNVFGERLAALGLAHRQAIYSRAQSVATENLILLSRVFAGHSDILRWRRPGGGMTAFPCLANGNDTRDVCKRLAKRGVLIVPGDCFGEPAHFRIGFGVRGHGFSAALERFSECLREIHPLQA